MMFGVYRPTFTGPNNYGKYDVLMKLVVSIHARTPEEAMTIAKRAGHLAPIVGPIKAH